MKKLALLIALSLLAKAEALPVGNPAAASLLCSGLFWNSCCEDPCCCIFSFRFGFYGDYVFNRHLRAKNDMIALGKSVEKAQLNTNAATIILGLWDLVDLYAAIGESKLNLQANDLLVPAPLWIETESHLSWSVGTRATLWQKCGTSFGIEAQYFAWKPALARFSFLASSFYPAGLTLNWQEWQIGAGISKKISFLIPYIAVKYSRSFAKFRIDVDRFVPFPFFSPTRFNSQKRWGYVCGVTLVDVSRMDVTAEARFGDEKAFHVNWQMRF